MGEVYPTHVFIQGVAAGGGILWERVSTTRNKTLGIDLGLKDFAIVHDAEELTKHSNPKQLNRHEKNLASKLHTIASLKKDSL